MLTIEQIKYAGGYSVIYADPPWSYDDKGSNGAADGHYSTMSVADICAMPVSEIVGKDAALFLWATWPLLPEAIQVMEAWGFKYKTVAFVWVKGQEKAFFGLGRWTRGNTEVCLLGIRGKPKRESAAVRQVLFETTEPLWDTETLAAPRGAHSAKPPEVRERIVSLLGDVPRLELFARERAEGWDAFGNQVPGGSDVSLEKKLPVGMYRIPRFA
jgi:N6-adenosine-specific RNA methylase IME4